MKNMYKNLRGEERGRNIDETATEKSNIFLKYFNVYHDLLSCILIVDWDNYDYFVDRGIPQIRGSDKT